MRRQFSISRREFLRAAGAAAGMAAAGRLAAPGSALAEQAGSYSTATDPFAAGTRVRAIVADARRGGGDHSAIVRRLFARLQADAEHGISREAAGVASDTRAPRTAEGTLAAGSGDCTEMASVVISCLRELGIDGGARIVHFRGNPEGVEHMVAFATISGTETTVDLQAAGIGQTASAIDRTVQTLTFAQAAGMYHREYGNFLRNSGNNSQALSAFEEAIRRNSGDAYSHHKIAVILQRSGRAEDRARASREHLRALELDPGNQLYLRNAAPAAYNAGFDAYEAGQAEDARTLFRQCVELSTRLQSGEGGGPGRAIGARYLQECRGALGQM